MASVSQRVVVVGGGISGLAAAHRLTELDPGLELVLLEAGSRLGGVIETVRRDGFLIEHSADNFITNVLWGVDFCQRIGLGEALVSTSRERPRALVVHRGRLVPVPAGFMLLAPARIGPLLSTPILSVRGKLRLLWEYFTPRRNDTDDESLASFARRRLGRETFERIVQPLVGGIYTADPEKLSLAATMPRFVEMERRHGGLIRGALAGGAATPGESGARYGLFVTPRDGLSSMIDAAAARLPEGCVRLNSPVERIARDGAGWKVSVGGAEPRELTAAAVIVAVGTPHAAAMLADVDPQLATDLGQIEHAGSAIVSLGYRREQIEHPLDGFGFVVPAVEKRRILAGSFSSLKFPGRAPEGSVLIRVFLGGACQSEMAELPDDELLRVAREELAELLGARGEPAVVDIARWPRSMPQYHVGHVERVAAIESRVERLPGLALAGNAYHGVGIPNCIHSGQQAAERVAAQLSSAADS